MATLTKTSGRKVVGSKVTYKFPDGTKFTGTYDQLEKVATTLGHKIAGISRIPKGYYMSESKGLVKITSMNDHHIRRALLKRTKDYFAGLYAKDDSNTSFLTKFTKLTDDSVVVELYNELSKRR